MSGHCLPLPSGFFITAMLISPWINAEKVWAYGMKQDFCISLEKTKSVLNGMTCTVREAEHTRYLLGSLGAPILFGFSRCWWRYWQVWRYVCGSRCFRWCRLGIGGSCTLFRSLCRFWLGEGIIFVKLFLELLSVTPCWALGRGCLFGFPMHNEWILVIFNVLIVFNIATFFLTKVLFIVRILFAASGEILIIAVQCRQPG